MVLLGTFGSKNKVMVSARERDFILRLHATKEDVPSNGIAIDATRPLVSVVDEILSHVRILKV